MYTYIRFALVNIIEILVSVSKRNQRRFLLCFWHKHMHTNMYMYRQPDKRLFSEIVKNRNRKSLILAFNFSPKQPIAFMFLPFCENYTKYILKYNSIYILCCIVVLGIPVTNWGHNEKPYTLTEHYLPFLLFGNVGQWILCNSRWMGTMRSAWTNTFRIACSFSSFIYWVFHKRKLLVAFYLLVAKIYMNMMFVKLVYEFDENIRFYQHSSV